jgi:hypothetical protein
MIGSRLKISFAIALILILPQIAFADHPLQIMRGTFAARFGLISVFEVQPGHETDFQTALVQSGPFSHLVPGFANERILEMGTTAGTDPAAAKTIGERVVSLIRCFDPESAQFIIQQRAPAIQGMLSSDPVYIPVKLVEHIFGNWSWEKRGAAASAFAIVTSTVNQTQSLLQQSITLFGQPNVSLSFLKDGYVGQLGMLETAPASADLQNIRGELRERTGLMGASIYQAADNSYLIYSEYFQAPSSSLANVLKTQPDKLQGAQLGSVVQNYASR